MKKLLFSLLICLVIISAFISCNGSEDMNIVSQTWGVIHEIYNLEYNQMVFNFSEILKEASKVLTEDDIIYLNGRISEYLLTNRVYAFSRLNYLFSRPDYLDENINNKIVRKKLREPIKELASDIELYLGDLKKNLIEEEDVIKIKEIKNEFVELSELLDKINFEGYDKEEYEKYFLDTINELSNMLKNAENIKK